LRQSSQFGSANARLFWATNEGKTWEASRLNQNVAYCCTIQGRLLWNGKSIEWKGRRPVSSAVLV
jgi:hypothetical protein